MNTKPILLDTHVFLWLIEGSKPLSPKITHLIKNAIHESQVLISAISIWEIAMLAQKERITFNIPVKQWFEKVLSAPSISIMPLTPNVLIESCLLPGNFHGDPADRMIVATARMENTQLITRDEKILEYAKTKNLLAIRA